MLYFLTSTMYRCIIVVVGVLYPAFNSYKSLNRRDGYEQVKWMMYWIVFAVFTACEVVTDLLICWMPFYYEGKVIFVLWLALPATRGSSYLYRRIIHPNLLKHETEIERYISRASNKGCEFLVEFGQHGINFAASAILQTASHLKRSYSVDDVSSLSAGQSGSHSGIMNRAISQSQISLNQLQSNDASEEGPGRRNRSKKSSSKQTSSASITGAQCPNSTPSGHSTRRSRKALHKVDEEN